MMEILRCTVNNKPVELGIDPRESLADTLRQRLGLTSVKKGCEVGECGACTVLVDGVAIDSCIYLSVWAQGKTILTVEGLQINCTVAETVSLEMVLRYFSKYSTTDSFE